MPRFTKESNKKLEVFWVFFSRVEEEAAPLAFSTQHLHKAASFPAFPLES